MWHVRRNVQDVSRLELEWFSSTLKSAAIFSRTTGAFVLDVSADDDRAATADDVIDVSHTLMNLDARSCGRRSRWRSPMHHDVGVSTGHLRRKQIAVIRRAAAGLAPLRTRDELGM